MTNLPLKWPDGRITCPRCGSDQCYELSTRPIIKCRACKKQASFKVGTIFEDSPLGLDKGVTQKMTFVFLSHW